MQLSDANESSTPNFWVGPNDEKRQLIYHAQRRSTEQYWFLNEELIELDPDYSEFSVRIHDPRCRSLSFIYRTIAILPKSKLRVIYNLIGAYLEKIDNPENKGS